MYMVLDTETGGLDYKKDALLTGALFAVSDKFEILESLDFTVKQQPGFNVSREALNVNKIDIDRHNASADEPLVAERKIRAFLSKYRNAVPLGHNIIFDLNFVKYQLPNAGWELMSYRLMDTMIVARFLQDKGTLPVRSVSLGTLTSYFGIEHDSAHEARADVEATIKVYKHLLAA